METETRRPQLPHQQTRGPCAARLGPEPRFALNVPHSFVSFSEPPGRSLLPPGCSAPRPRGAWGGPYLRFRGDRAGLLSENLGPPRPGRSHAADCPPPRGVSPSPQNKHTNKHVQASRSLARGSGSSPFAEPARFSASKSWKAARGKPGVFRAVICVVHTVGLWGAEGRAHRAPRPCASFEIVAHYQVPRSQRGANEIAVHLEPSPFPRQPPNAPPLPLSSVVKYVNKMSKVVLQRRQKKKGLRGRRAQPPPGSP